MGKLNLLNKISDFLGKKVKLIKDEYTNLEIEISNDGTYSIPKSKFPVWNEVREDIEEDFNISKETGKELESIFYDKDNIVGVHRGGSLSEENTSSIIEKGLYLTGHLSSGAAPSVSPELNIVFFNERKDKNSDYIMLIRQIKATYSYKTFDNEGTAVIVVIPKEDFNDINKISYEIDGHIALKPQYIYGSVKVKENDNGIVEAGNINHNPNYSIERVRHL